MREIVISEAAADILRRSTVQEDRVVLPTGQLDRALYMDVDKVLKALGGQWNRGAKAHVFTTDPKEVLKKALGDGSAPGTGTVVSEKKVLQAFFTPTETARELVKHVLEWVPSGKKNSKPVVLEPSAGNGRIVDVIREEWPTIWRIECVEIHQPYADALKIRGYTVVCKDFTQMKPISGYDAVVMNPPFTGGQDIAHVTHAFKFLRPGGILGAIVSPSFQSNGAKKYAEFRTLHDDHLVFEYPLPAGTFRESGTDVRAVAIGWKK